jgi:hypothetical protein
VDIVRSFLDRIEEVNPTINAVVHLAADEAIEAARRADAAVARGDELGALHGVPITLKDSIDTAGMVSTGGTLGRADFVPGRGARTSPWPWPAGSNRPLAAFSHPPGSEVRQVAPLGVFEKRGSG